jgi:teichuronic acid exporter
LARKKIFDGVLWSGIERFSVQIVQFIISVILARIISPSEFGLLALIMVVLNILQVINEVGFGAALMQKTDRDDLDFSTVFVVNLLLGIVLYFLLFLLAPYVAMFFENKEISYLLRITGLNIIISSFVIIQRTRLWINVDFKTLAKASLFAVVISGIIGVHYAYSGWGIMSLIIYSILNNFLNTVFVWFFVKWKISFHFSFQRLKSLFKFAFELSLARLVNTVFNEIYSIVIGKVFTQLQLGYFYRAKGFVDIASGNITSMVQRVSIPLLCEAQHDNKRIEKVLLGFITDTSFFIFPLMCGLFVLAEPLICVLLTDKWLYSVWILRVLCPVGMMYVISTFNINVFNATGRTDWALKSEIFKKILFLALIVISLYIGFEALIFCQVLIAILELIISTYYTKKQIGLSLHKQLTSVASIFTLSLIMAIFIWCVNLLIIDKFYALFVGIIIGLITYGGFAILFNVNNFRIKLSENIKISSI